MPADSSLSQEPSARHGRAIDPYPCSVDPEIPGADWSLDYGYCRTSLDHHTSKNPETLGQLLTIGSGDPRCPASCPHKAPLAVAQGFMQRFPQGVPVAIAWVKQQKGGDHGR